MVQKLHRLVKGLGWSGFFRLLVHLPSFGKLLIRLAKDPRVGLAPKLLLVAVLVYLIWPMDILPDFLLGIGQMDDLAVILAGARTFLRLCPAAVVEEHVKAISAENRRRSRA